MLQGLYLLNEYGYEYVYTASVREQIENGAD